MGLTNFIAGKKDMTQFQLKDGLPKMNIKCWLRGEHKFSKTFCDDVLFIMFRDYPINLALDSNLIKRSSI